MCAGHKFWRKQSSQFEEDREKEQRDRKVFQKGKLWKQPNPATPPGGLTEKNQEKDTRLFKKNKKKKTKKAKIKRKTKILAGAASLRPVTLFLVPTWS